MKKSKKILATIGLLTMLSIMILPSLALALDTGINYGTLIGLGTRDIRETVMMIIQVVLSFLGIIAIVIVLLGGFKWMTAGGSEDKVGEARKLIVAGIIGLAIVFASYAIASFVVNQLYKATTDTTDTTE